MTTAILAARLIQSFEGLKLRAYWDRSGKKWTVGFGHTGPDVKPNMVITRDQADILFLADSAPLLKMVDGLPMIAAAAFCSFGYNCGRDALRRALDGEIRVSDYGRTSGGSELAGLGARRDLESALIEASKEFT
jgi:lysozyme